VALAFDTSETKAPARIVIAAPVAIKQAESSYPIKLNILMWSA